MTKNHYQQIKAFAARASAQYPGTHEQLMEECTNKYFETLQEQTGEQVKKEIAGILGIIASNIRDTGQCHLAEIKLGNILALFTPKQEPNETKNLS